MPRAWKFVGNAIYSATAIGLHVKTQGKGSAHSSHRQCNRLWWAVFLLGTTLCTMTGRPPGMIELFCATHLPVAKLGGKVWNQLNAPIPKSGVKVLMGKEPPHTNQARKRHCPKTIHICSSFCQVRPCLPDGQEILALNMNFIPRKSCQEKT